MDGYWNRTRQGKGKGKQRRGNERVWWIRMRDDQYKDDEQGYRDYGALGQGEKETD